jgi:hypothetical protein
MHYHISVVQSERLGEIQGNAGLYEQRNGGAAQPYFVRYLERKAEPTYCMEPATVCDESRRATLHPLSQQAGALPGFLGYVSAY